MGGRPPVHTERTLTHRCPRPHFVPRGREWEGSFTGGLGLGSRRSDWGRERHTDVARHPWVAVPETSAPEPRLTDRPLVQVLDSTLPRGPSRSPCTNLRPLPDPVPHHARVPTGATPPTWSSSRGSTQGPEPPGVTGVTSLPDPSRTHRSRHRSTRPVEGDRRHSTRIDPTPGVVSENAPSHDTDRTAGARHGRRGRTG